MTRWFWKTYNDDIHMGMVKRNPEVYGYDKSVTINIYYEHLWKTTIFGISPKGVMRWYIGNDNSCMMNVVINNDKELENIIEVLGVDDL